MAGSSSEESGVGRSLEGMSNGQQLSGEALAEWRSSEQVENGITSTSPPYWDTDDGEDCDAGPKPSELYGKYTWKIDKFSQINKRELRSNAFEVGGYKWYILIYPQGCDVCNHLSLFLCVANHDKLLPGWSHFAQFTIAVVNKDPKKSKYSDTLHRFWKKEHDWGWKKFMELSKVLDGFVDGDTLIIKAQVQVIRERPDRPFRCLDCQYRRELVRVYLSNVEQICRRFVEERRGRLGKLIEDKVRWSSLCSFWLAIDENGRRRMSREKSDLILKVAVKQFFIEKEVTSTLVMDSLYSGLKALEARSQTKSKKAEEPLPIVRVEKDMFILVDDVLLLLERAALEPLPPKDEKGPQNRTKDGGSGEDFNKDSIERDERRLTELGRRTIEIFVLAHIFSSKIEIAYQEAVALKRQEELIREEEAAWMTGIEQKAKRGASEKEKKSKKKQGKQKRNNNRKVKDKGKEEKAGSAVVEETLVQPADSDDRDSSSPLNWDTDTPTEPASSVSAIHINNNNNNNNNDNDNINGERKSISSATAMDDSSSSTCSTDSLPSVMMNPPYKGQKSQKSFTRGKDKAHLKVGGKYKKVDDESDVVVVSLKDQMKWLQRHMEEVVSLQKEVNVKDEVDHVETSLKEKTGPKTSPLPLKKNAPAFVRKPPTDTDKANSAHKNGTQEKPSTTEKTMTTDKPPAVVVHQVPRPSVSMVESAPFLSHSVSADRSFVPQSYRNVMMGNTSSQPPPTFLLPQKTPDSNNSFRPQMGMMLNDVQNPPDEFPHLDIINDLLDDATELQRPHQLTCQFTYPGSDIDHGPYTSNSCRSERIQSYHDEFQHSYDLSREMMVPQPYMNGHIRNQWHQQQQQMDHLSYLGLRNMDNDGYQYPQYSNLLMGVHAYTVYPPSNGQ